MSNNIESHIHQGNNAEFTGPPDESCFICASVAKSEQVPVERRTFPVRFGDHIVGKGWVENGETVTIAIDPVNQNVVDFLVGDAYKYFDISPAPAVQQSNLVDHARRELELIGEEPETIEGYLNVVQAFANMGHSGGSASVAIPVINRLLKFLNLKPLTNNPNEWQQVEMGDEPCWQSRRRSEAFSYDHGKTYYLLSEGGNSENRHPIHRSEEIT